MLKTFELYIELVYLLDFFSLFKAIRREKASK